MPKTNQPSRKILILDDHPINVESYQTLLSDIESNKSADYLIAFDCEQAYNTILKNHYNKELIDYAFIDISLPPYKEKNLFSGSDVALIIRNFFPNCKIIIISMHKEPLWVNQIQKSIIPEGFIAKSDINYKIFPEIFKCIEKNETYLSTSIINAQRLMIQKNINWDEYDSKILQLLSEGVRTINIPDYMPLSLSSIEKRKANIKKQLLLNPATDRELIDIAKKFGFI
ncbi:response regulator [Flavobacterium sp. SUN046]|uniref:response regulator n=1 Tax=Flavobacterium sp. SUN046 TaxID=3002440 RepID=UPI002DB88CEB|nr:response regulator [Flavobacterium sp. SUN046]MEC4048839.1 response regulator [Flavobacterium sp. SUN046]